MLHWNLYFCAIVSHSWVGLRHKQGFEEKKSWKYVLKIHCCILWNVLRCLVLNIIPTENIVCFINDKPFTWIIWMSRLCVFFCKLVIYWVTVFVIASFCFILFCEITESGMEKAWQLLRLWKIKKIWHIKMKYDDLFWQRYKPLKRSKYYASTLRCRR